MIGRNTWLVRAAAVLGLLAAALFAVPAAAGAVPPPHVATGTDTDECAMCHRVHTSFSPVTWTSAASGEATGDALLVGDLGNGDDTRLCLSCHGVGSLGSTKDVGTSFAEESTHSLAPDPSAYGPSPKQCSSCHDSHGTARTVDGTTFPALLSARGATGTVESGEEFCAACHSGPREHRGIRNDFDGISVFRQTGHYTGLPDPADGTGIRCSICHEAHGSNVAPLITKQLVPPAVPATVTVSADDRAFCIDCHAAPSATWPGPAIYASSSHGSSTATTAVSGEWPLRYASARPLQRRVGECQNCHDPMGRSDGAGGVIPKLVNGPGSTVCYRCHSSSGPAKSDLASLAAVEATGRPDLVTIWSPSDRSQQYGNLSVWSHEATASGTPLVGPRQFDVGAVPGAAAAGDINGDGKAEIIVAHKGASVLSVFSTDPLRGLARHDYPIEGEADFLAVANLLPGSSVPQIAVVDHSTGLLRLYRWVGGTLQLMPGVYDVGTDVSGMASGDVTGSAQPDLVITSSSEQALRIFMESGQTLVSNGLFATGPAPQGPSVGDAVRGGLKNEFVVANSGVSLGVNGVSVFTGDGAEICDRDTFPASDRPVATLVARVLTGVAGSDTIVALDGGPGSDAYVDVFTQDANGGLSAAPQSVLLGKDRHPVALAAGDLDGDGSTELAVVDAGLFTGSTDGQDPDITILKSNRTGDAIDSQSATTVPGGGRELAGGAPSLAIADLGMIGASRHPVDAGGASHVSTETPAPGGKLAAHVVCTDCHNPHTATSEAASAPAVQGPLAGAWGVAVTNNSKASVDYSEKRGVAYEYQVCFKCHSGWSDVGASDDTAFDFNPDNASVHAVEQTASDSQVPTTTFVGGYSNSTLLYCGDCHGNSVATQAAGPHRSDSAPLLVAPLFGAPADQQGALCYRCHKYEVFATGTLGSRFVDGSVQLHAAHVGQGGFDCSACHVSHGAPDEPYLLRSDIGYATSKDGGRCNGSCHAGALQIYTRP